MKFKTALMLLGVIAIPAWYAHRTLNEKRARHLEWNEIFMTEEARQAKWAEEKQKAREAAEAERVQRTTELEKATAARKVAEVEAAKAKIELARTEGEILQKKASEAAEVDRRRMQADRNLVEQAAARSRAEAERVAVGQHLTARVQVCVDLAKAAETHMKELIEEQKSYLKFTEEISQVPLFKNGPVLPDTFSKTFRMLSRAGSFTDDDKSVIRSRQAKCETVAKDQETKDTDYNWQSARNEVDWLSSGYESSIRSLKASRSDLRDLVDYATGELPDTVAGRVKSGRVHDLIVRSYDWHEFK